MNLHRPLILSSNSPRRQELLRALGYTFEVKVKDTEESFPDGMTSRQVAVYLARKKAAAFTPAEIGQAVLITADTVVCLGDQILNKPGDKAHAVEMLKRISGRSHSVITGVCLRSADEEKAFYEETKVYFRELNEEEIGHYIDTCKPFDKAGAYGIQEWIGMVGVTKLEGSYYNVMGLPVHRLYQELAHFEQGPA